MAIEQSRLSPYRQMSFVWEDNNFQPAKEALGSIVCNVVGYKHFYGRHPKGFGEDFKYFCFYG